MDREITLVRWGEVGQPVLIFPTAGGDCEEIERFHLVDACAELLGDQRAKIYSVDSLAGRAWLTGSGTKASGSRVQLQYDDTIYHEVLPAIRKDCGADDVPIVTAGASIGAYNALAFLCRHPDACTTAICLSGTYDLDRFLKGPETRAYHDCSPIHAVPQLDEDGDHLARLRENFVLLAHGEGANEAPEESWKVERALGARSVPNRVDSWGPEWPHDWQTWRAMMPKYLDEFLPTAATD